MYDKVNICLCTGINYKEDKSTGCCKASDIHSMIVSPDQRPNDILLTKVGLTNDVITTCSTFFLFNLFSNFYYPQRMITRKRNVIAAVFIVENYKQLKKLALSYKSLFHFSFQYFVGISKQITVFNEKSQDKGKHDFSVCIYHIVLILNVSF